MKKRYILKLENEMEIPIESTSNGKFVTVYEKANEELDKVKQVDFILTTNVKPMKLQTLCERLQEVMGSKITAII